MRPRDHICPQRELINPGIVDVVCRVQSHNTRDRSPCTKSPGAQRCDRRIRGGLILVVEGFGRDAGRWFGGSGGWTGVDFARAGEGDVGLDAVCY